MAAVNTTTTTTTSASNNAVADRAATNAARVKSAKANGKTTATSGGAADDDGDEWSDDEDDDVTPSPETTAHLDDLESAGGLWISSQGKLSTSSIPDCQHCGGRRSAEAQILPTLLSYLSELDHTKPEALDWGVLNLYTCERSCDVARHGGVVEEVCWRQEYDVKTGIY